jgi:replication fork protection complex subunit Csm3/Swi3
MLNMYQLWLDDLYPRAKFADALAIIEKVGHTKRMQVMRKDWIDEGKPRRATDRDEEDIEENVPERPSTEQITATMEGIEQDQGAEEQQYGAEEQAQAKEGADPDEDELDALLAESAQFSTSTSKTLPSRTAGTVDDPFADEMEAMADMGGMW